MSDDDRRELAARAATQVHELAYPRDVRARGAELIKAGLRLQSATQAASAGDNPDEGSTTWRPQPGAGLAFTAKGGGGFEVPLPRLSEDEAALLAWLLGKSAGAIPEFATSKRAV
jgi:hypothetical protein